MQQNYQRHNSPEFARPARNRITKQPILIRPVATIIVSIAQPPPHYAHIRIRTLHTQTRPRIALPHRTAHLVRRVPIPAIHHPIAPLHHRNTPEIPALKLRPPRTLRVHAARLITTITALIHPIAALHLRQTPPAPAPELRRLTAVIRAEVHRFIAAVRTMPGAIADKALLDTLPTGACELCAITDGCLNWRTRSIVVGQAKTHGVRTAALGAVARLDYGTNVRTASVED